MTTIPLGFEVHAGGPVAVPLKHLAITGQTQEAGKTTALEALISRSGLRAVTFITKRGEGAFTSARRIPPYFREQADWQFVASILEASRGEKLKFERAWIIRASRGALTLAAVHQNVKKAMTTAKGLSADVYLTLDAYLEVVVPQIGQVRWATGVHLEPGVNAMDLTALSTEMQHLVIKSTLDYVLKHHADTVVVVPEAWQFIPQGRGTPVKLAAETFVRQAAALGNYLWLDSQDLGGVDKTILRSVAVWILGVQREANEISRTLANIPGVVAKPKATDLALLELGQFYVCWGKHAIRTYVQPVWMHAPIAQQVARGELDVRNASAIAQARTVGTAFQRVFATEGNTVTSAEAKQLEDDNAALRAEIKALRRQLEAAMAKPLADEQPKTKPAPPPSIIGSFGDDEEARYQRFKARLVADAPAIFTLSVQQPEIEITIQRPRLQFEEHSLKWRIARLLRDQVFKAEALSCGQIRSALKRTGPDANTANIGRAMADLVKAGIFTNEGDGYRPVPGIPVRTIEGEQ